MRRLNWAAAWLLSMGSLGSGTTFVSAQTPLLDNAVRRSNSVNAADTVAPPEGPLSLLIAPSRESALGPRRALSPASAGPAARAVSRPVQSSTRDPIFRRSAAEVRMDRLLSRPRGEQAAEEAERELREFGVNDLLAPSGFDSPDR